jgi:signal transduction histidine kinase
VYRDTFVKSMVIVPIRTGSPIGAIGNYWATRHRATAVQVRLLQALADLTSVALENVQLYEELRKRIEDARLGEQRQAFLARATALLASSIEYEQTLNSIGKLVVPELADWYAVDLVEDERIVQVALEHADPRKVELARELRSRYTQPNDTTRGAAKAIRTGEPEIVRVTDELLEQVARDAEHLAILRDLGLRSYMVVPLKHSQGVIGAMALVSERADRLYGQADLELVMELARRCAAAIENARLYKQAQEAIRSRDEFLSIAAHELRTPLTALHLQLQSLADLARAAPVDERLASRGVRAVANMQRLTTLVDELLDVSRLTLGKLTLSPEPVDLAATTREIAERFREPADCAGSSISVAALKPVEGSWDRFRIEQVVTNLLSNAMKYGAGKPIELTVTESGELARLEVRDHGIGLSSDDARRIFERFERAVPMRHYGGLGLGLYICRQIVEAHGGCIWAEGEPGAGARFVVELPTPPQR